MLRVQCSRGRRTVGLLSAWNFVVIRFSKYHTIISLPIHDCFRTRPLSRPLSDFQLEWSHSLKGFLPPSKPTYITFLSLSEWISSYLSDICMCYAYDYTFLNPATGSLPLLSPPSFLFLLPFSSSFLFLLIALLLPLRPSSPSFLPASSLLLPSYPSLFPCLPSFLFFLCTNFSQVALLH